MQSVSGNKKIHIGDMEMDNSLLQFMAPKRQTVEAVLFFMKGCLVTSSITGKRNAVDFVSDRIVQASASSNLLAFGEKFRELLGAGAVHNETAQRFISGASGGYASCILTMLRRYPKIISQMLFISSKKKEDEEESPFSVMLRELDIEALAPDINLVSDHVAHTPFGDIPLEITCLSPLAHGSDSKSGNATLFRRMEVMGKKGSIMSLPFYAGNALRGQLRDCLADHFLEAMGSPKLSLWFFHAIYAGGALEEGENKALMSKIGLQRGIRPDGMREFRNMLPALSLMGAALGNRIIPGRIMVGDLRPRCKEWKTGELPAAELFDWQFLTRRDDHAEDRAEGEDHHGMIAMTETIKTGAVLDGWIDISDHISDMEMSALFTGLGEISRRGKLGAENRRGFGKVRMLYPEDDQEETINMYPEYLAERKQDILKYLEEIGAIIPQPSQDAEAQQEKDLI